MEVELPFKTEYAKSGRASCKGCKETISQGSVRIAAMVQSAFHDGKQANWFHESCFFKKQRPGSVGDIANYENLRIEDQKRLEKKIETLGNGVVVSTSEKKSKKRSKAENVALKDFSIEYAKSGRAACRGCEQKILKDQVRIRKTVYDTEVGMKYGGQALWHHCEYPKRGPCKVPTELKKKYKFLKEVGKNPEVRAIRYVPPSAAVIAKSVDLKKDNDLVDGPKIKRDRPPLYNLTFSYVGLKGQEEKLKNRVAQMGGKCETKITEKTVAVFSTAKEVERLGTRMEKAKELGLHVIPIDYLDSVDSDASGAISFITSMSLCDWGTDPSARVPQEEKKSLKSKSIYTKSVPTSMTLKIKDGLAVDPDSGLEDVAHVYIAKNKDKYNAVLGQTDIQRNKNSYYKLQLLRDDKKNRFWVFRSWGRIGTTIGGHKLEKFPNLNEAIESFKALYLEKSGNDFENRDKFVKVTGRMYPIDIDYSEEAKVDLSAEHSIKSKLPMPVQDIIKLIFDIDTMKRTMLEFDLDMEKMPLGKLSQKQIQSAYKVLTEIHGLIQESGTNTKFIDATNRFYTLIPHNFGTQSPPLLDT
uniref:NAD(+) ADP-ribosyltransferase n=1 Tax=Glossina austeni TaxID=7395 RepID=A0A1A9VJ13_GLOAU